MKRFAFVVTAVFAAVLLADPAGAWPASYSNSGPYLSYGSGSARRCAFFGHATSHGSGAVSVSGSTIATYDTSCSPELATPAGTTVATVVFQAQNCAGTWVDITSVSATNVSGRSYAIAGGTFSSPNYLSQTCGGSSQYVPLRTVSGHSVQISGVAYSYLDVRPAFYQVP